MALRLLQSRQDEDTRGDGKQKGKEKGEVNSLKGWGWGLGGEQEERRGRESKEKKRSPWGGVWEESPRAEYPQSHTALCCL